MQEGLREDFGVAFLSLSRGYDEAAIADLIYIMSQQTQVRTVYSRQVIDISNVHGKLGQDNSA